MLVHLLILWVTRDENALNRQLRIPADVRVSKHKDPHVSHSSELCLQSSRYEGFSAFEVINPIVVIFEAVATKSYPTDF